ncbi:MAG: ISKra4 family transposase [Anaerolineae bacterium]|nr:ISKra4 family transposase [Anaerolineae bacterium]
MASNSQEIIQDVHAQFEHLIDFVTGEKAQVATADHIERGLFKLLVILGASLLQLFFVLRSKACSRETMCSDDHKILRYHRDTVRHYYSIFGKITFERPYFYNKNVGKCIPLDEALSLGADGYSDLLRELSGYVDVDSVYEKTADIFKRLLGLSLSTRDLQQNVAEDSIDVEAYYDQKSPPQPVLEATILVAQADGKGVPMILEEDETKTKSEPVRLGKGQKRGNKKEAIVTSAYTIAPAVRTPEEVVASYFDLSKAEFAKETQLPDGHSRPKPQNKHVWATLDGKDTALSRLSRLINLHEGTHIQERVALCDGCEALQLRIAIYLSGFTILLDFIHASEYLWKVANVLLGETNPLRIEWMAEKTLLMLSGKTDQLIADFLRQAQLDETSAAQRSQLNITANYFERNLPYMDYPIYLAKGWPIASGVIEGACRHFVKDRCELSGMRWTQTGAESLLRLRAIAENGDWDAYHTYRKAQRHIRIYGKPWSEPITVAFQDLGLPKTDLELVAICDQQTYERLPLAA